ncbi:hypothetical protein [Silanimonas sp.]|jgi:hypothetical protein|uniref:hypothetical protein n=1 Tax=Silanimonas sp. TaxID=1929290 RepID=UPI0022C727D4|nr:hypothetical protein [Silanimonas sp.]MCZ8064038.1 hypothetical protein [Silanimonas sp.]
MELLAPQILRAGRELIDPILLPCGFSWGYGASGASSGGNFASGCYSRDDRALELHYRFSLGLVSYRMGELCIDHAEYMSVVAQRGQSQYPGFSDDPLDGFRHLAHDLVAYCAAFLRGPDAEFARVVELVAAKPQGRRLPLP